MGDSRIRAIQQALNNKYSITSDGLEYLSRVTGSMERNTCNALLYAFLKKEVGIDEPNGVRTWHSTGSE